MNTVLNAVIANTQDNTSTPDNQEKPATSIKAIRKTPAKKAIAQKTVAKKIVAKKPTVKKAAAKKAPATKTGVKVTAAVKLPVQKSTATKVKPAAVKNDASTQKIKVKKQKMVRDSFTMPESEYQTLSDLKKSCLNQGIAVKKSELLRIGVALLKSMTAKQIDTARNKLEKISAGRPKKD